MIYNNALSSPVYEAPINLELGLFLNTEHGHLLVLSRDVTRPCEQISLTGGWWLFAKHVRLAWSHTTFKFTIATLEHQRRRTFRQFRQTTIRSPTKCLRLLRQQDLRAPRRPSESLPGRSLTTPTRQRNGTQLRMRSYKRRCVIKRFPRRGRGGSSTQEACRDGWDWIESMGATVVIAKEDIKTL